MKHFAKGAVSVLELRDKEYGRSRGVKDFEVIPGGLRLYCKRSKH